MPLQRSPSAHGDLLAGAAAALVLAGCVFVLRLHPVLAALLALGVYGGLSLLDFSGQARPSWYAWGWPFSRSTPATPDELAFRAASANAAAIWELADRVAKPATREQLHRILDRIDQILTVMRADDDLTAAPVLDTLLLEPLRALLAEYVRIANRGVVGATDLLEKIETVDLPSFEQTIDDFYGRQHHRQMIDLATLSELLQFNLERVRATPRRRKTP